MTRYENSQNYKNDVNDSNDDSEQWQHVLLNHLCIVGMTHDNVNGNSKGQSNDRSDNGIGVLSITCASPTAKHDWQQQ